MYHTFEEMIQQIEECEFECEAGPLKNNQGWIELKRKVQETLEKEPCQKKV